MSEVNHEIQPVEETTNAVVDIPVEGEQPDNSPMVSLSVDELIIGRPLSFPLYAENGLLLLASGATITSEFKRLLKSRGTESIKTSEQAAKRISTSHIATIDTSKLSFDTDLTRKLDSYIEGGLIAVKNTGPAVKDNMVFIGKKAYDSKQRQELVSKHNQNSGALGKMMNEALHGESIDGGLVAVMAADYLRQMTVDSDNVLSSTVESLSSDDIAADSLDVSLLSMAIGIEMGLDENNVRDLGLIGLVQDWGMLKVPAEVRRAHRALSMSEVLEIKRHPIHSLEILQKVSALPNIVPLVAYQVHERPNGSGYPRGRRGASIHPFARIVGVASSYVAMTAARPYRKAIIPYHAMENLLRQSKDGAVDRDVVRALLNVLSLFPLKSFIALSDGSIACVIRRNLNDFTRPIVQRVQDANGDPVPGDESQIINLAESELKVVQALPTPGKQDTPISEEYKAFLT